MSSMLDQAIIDATALREAAIKSAEQVVVSQYSEQIKNTVEELLEQEDLGMDLGMDPATDAAAGEPAEPPAHPEYDSTEYTTDKDEEYSKSLDAQIPLSLNEMLPDVDISDDTVLEIELAELDYENDEVAPDGVKVVKESDAEESVAIEDEELKELAEALKFDYELVADGGFANGQMIPTNSVDDTREIKELAAMIDEYNQDLEEKSEVIQKENKELKKTNLQLKKFNTKLFETVKEFKKNFEKVQLMNAKLLYVNKTLTDASLNERQKNKIVESINNVDSIEQAKIVYETLQSAVGLSQERKPKSLSEAVSKRNSSSIVIHARKEKKLESTSDKFSERMKRLAGIKHN
jgi:hypothetical protein